MVTWQRFHDALFCSWRSLLRLLYLLEVKVFVLLVFNRLRRQNSFGYCCLGPLSVIVVLATDWSFLEIIKFLLLLNDCLLLLLYQLFHVSLSHLVKLVVCDNCRWFLSLFTKWLACRGFIKLLWTAPWRLALFAVLLLLRIGFLLSILCPNDWTGR